MKQPRNWSHSFLYPAILMLSAILLAGCSKPIEEAIIGKWGEGKHVNFEFFHDNTFLFNDGSKQLSGRWMMVGDDRIKADIPVFGTTVTLVFEDIEISGNKMTLTSKGKKGTLNRIK